MGAIAVVGSWSRRIGVLLALVAAWDLATEIGHYGSGFIPSPRDTAEALLQWIGLIAGPPGEYSGTWSDAVIASTARVLSGFAIAAIVGIPTGIGIGRYRVVADLLDPPIQLLRPIPVSAWVPFSLVFFGIRPAAAVFLVAIGAFFPVVLNTAAGARYVSELHLRGARMLGASSLRTLWAVILPASLPSILTGLRLAMGLAWVLVIVAEMISVKSGLGYELWNAYYYARMDVIVAAMVTIGALGFAFDRLILFASNSVLSWHRATDQ
jgi:NitT/TauT family transport system permease protein